MYVMAASGRYNMIINKQTTATDSFNLTAGPLFVPHVC